VRILRGQLLGRVKQFLALSRLMSNQEVLRHAFELAPW
jgi:hypothetical protein